MRIRQNIARIVTLAAMAVSLPAFGATVTNIDFATATDYANNFVGVLNAAAVTHNAANQNVVYAPSAAQQTSIIRYDTNPGDAQPGPADFQSETLKFDT